MRIYLPHFLETKQVELLDDEINSTNSTPRLLLLGKSYKELTNKDHPRILAICETDDYKFAQMLVREGVILERLDDAFEIFKRYGFNPTKEFYFYPSDAPRNPIVVSDELETVIARPARKRKVKQ